MLSWVEGEQETSLKRYLGPDKMEMALLTIPGSDHSRAVLLCFTFAFAILS